MKILALEAEAMLIFHTAAPVLALVAGFLIFFVYPIALFLTLLILSTAACQQPSRLDEAEPFDPLPYGDVLFLPFTGARTDSLIAAFDKKDEAAAVGHYRVCRGSV